MSPTGSPAASQAGTGEVVRTAADGVGRITLNRPAAINALTAEMIAAVDEALEAWADDDAVRTVLLDGAGERGFCAGADVRALREAVLDGATERAVGFLRAEYRLDERIATYPKPVVALMDGITMGGGVGLSAHAAVRVVTERSVVAMPETRIGFVPDVGSTHLLGRAPGRTGFHVGLRAASVGPGDAIYLGLADHLVPAADLPALVEEPAARAWPGGPRGRRPVRRPGPGARAGGGAVVGRRVLRRPDGPRGGPAAGAARGTRSAAGRRRPAGPLPHRRRRRAPGAGAGRGGHPARRAGAGACGPAWAWPGGRARRGHPRPGSWTRTARRAGDRRPWPRSTTRTSPGSSPPTSRRSGSPAA